jgi:hypothetical protein
MQRFVQSSCRHDVCLICLQGTWQFISASLLMDPGKRHELADDLESFLHVVTWLVLRFSSHNLSEPLLATLLQAVFDEGSVEQSGREVGGQSKADALQGGRIARTVKFHSRPKLDSLLSLLTNTFAARYENITFGTDNEQERVIMSARHQRRMDHLQTSDWMLKQGRDALQVRSDWPGIDKPIDLLKNFGNPQRKKRKSNRASAFDVVRKRRIVAIDVDGEESVSDDEGDDLPQNEL